MAPRFHNRGESFNEHHSVCKRALATIQRRRSTIIWTLVLSVTTPLIKRRRTLCLVKIGGIMSYDRAEIKGPPSIRVSQGQAEANNHAGRSDHGEA